MLLRIPGRVTRKSKSTPNRFLSSLIQTIPLKQKSIRLKGFGLLPGWSCFLSAGLSLLLTDLLCQC